MSCRVLVLPVLKELKELLRTTLLKQAHKGAPDRLHLRAGHLRDFAVAVHKAAGDLLELEVPRNIGVNQNASEFSGRDDELGDEVDGIVAIAPEFSRRGLVGSEVTVELDACGGLSESRTR